MKRILLFTLLALCSQSYASERPYSSLESPEHFSDSKYVFQTNIISANEDAKNAIEILDNQSLMKSGPRIKIESLKAVKELILFMESAISKAQNSGYMVPLKYSLINEDLTSLNEKISFYIKMNHFREGIKTSNIYLSGDEFKKKNPKDKRFKINIEGFSSSLKFMRNTFRIVVSSDKPESINIEDIKYIDFNRGRGQNR